MLEISIRTRSLRYPLLDLISIFDRGIKRYVVVGQRSNNFHFRINKRYTASEARRPVNKFIRTDDECFIIFYNIQRARDIHDSCFDTLRGKGLRKEIISSERGVILSKSNSIRQSVSKEGNWPCIRVKYYPIRGRWKNRKEFAEARSYKSREAATRWTPSHQIDETNPNNFRLCYSHTRERSIRASFHSFMEPRSFPPLPRFVSTRVR